MKKPKVSWMINAGLKDIIEISDEMIKWSDYLRFSAQAGDIAEVEICLNQLELLFNRAKGK